MGTTEGDWIAGDDLEAGDDLVVTDDATIGGDLSVTGATSLGAITFTGTFAFTGSTLDMDPTGAFTLDMDALMTATITIADNLADAFVVADAGGNYISCDSTTGSELLELGNATDNVAISQLGTGQVTFPGNVDAQSGLDVTTAALTAAAALTCSGGAFTFTGTNINLDPTGTFDLAMDSGQAFSVDINSAASNISLATTGGAEDLTVEVTGATDSSLVLQSAGTGADAVLIAASAGGIDVNSAGAFTMDSVTMSLDCTDDSNLTMTTNAAGDKTLTISASNAGAGAGDIALTADALLITGDTDVTGYVDATTTVRGSTLIADGDAGGVASTNALTNATLAAGANGATLIQVPGTGAAAQVGWIKVYVGTTAYAVPYWAAS